MDIVDVNVSKLDKYNMEDELYYDSLWENMFDEGKYTDDGCNEAVGFIYSNACHAEVYGNAMDVTWIRIVRTIYDFLLLQTIWRIILWAQSKRKLSQRKTTEQLSLLTMAYILTSSSISRSVTYRFSLTRKPRKPSSEGASINQLRIEIWKI